MTPRIFWLVIGIISAPILVGILFIAYHIYLCVQYGKECHIWVKPQVEQLLKKQGLTLDGISVELTVKIPPHLDFNHTTNNGGNCSVDGLQEFRKASHPGCNGDFSTFGMHTCADRSCYSENSYSHGFKRDEVRQLLPQAQREASKKVNSCGRSTIGSFSGTVTVEGRTYNVAQGPNQYDASRIVGGENPLIVCSEPNKTDSKEGIRPFLDILKPENVKVILDLRYDTQNPSYLEGETAGAGITSCSIENTEPYTCRSAKYTSTDGKTSHTFAHLAVKDLPDNGAPNNEGFSRIMRALDRAAAARPGGIVFHCNGGLGRAPTIMTARALWNAARTARDMGIGLTSNWERDAEPLVNGKLNMAHVLRNVYIQGVYSRSVFIQSHDQLQALQQFAEYLCR